MSVDPTQQDEDRKICNPCRGTGHVISNLGGERREVTCPWCEGSGEVKPEHDAQEQAPQAPQAPPGAGGEPPAEQEPAH
jgi:DnaJ-class molecular chaperone